MWFKEMLKQITSGRKCIRCDENDEEQEVLNAPTMDWDVGNGMKNIRNHAVLLDIQFDWNVRINKVTN